MKTVVTYTNDTYDFAVITAEHESSIRLLKQPDNTVQLLTTVVSDKRDKVCAVASALGYKPHLFNDLQELAYKHELDWEDAVNLALPVGSIHLFHERIDGEDTEQMYLINTGKGLMQGGYFFSPALTPVLVADTYVYPYQATLDNGKLKHRHTKPAPQSLLLLAVLQLSSNVPTPF